MRLHPPDDKAGEQRAKERGRPDREPPRLGFWLVLWPEWVRGWGVGGAHHPALALQRARGHCVPVLPQELFRCSPRFAFLSRILASASWAAAMLSMGCWWGFGAFTAFCRSSFSRFRCWVLVRLPQVTCEVS